MTDLTPEQIAQAIDLDEELGERELSCQCCVAVDMTGLQMLKDALAAEKAAREEAAELAAARLADIKQERAVWKEWLAAEKARADRHGPCICNTGPGTEGPDEFCPQHGRTYDDVLTRCGEANARADEAEQELAVMGKLSDDWRARAFKTKARVAALEAGINALADRLELEANCNWTNKTQTLPLVRTLRALIEKEGRSDG